MSSEVKNEWRGLARNMSALKADLPWQQAFFAEALGAEWLRALQDEIVRLKVIDTRLLLSSFNLVADGVWGRTVTSGDRTSVVLIASTVKYAAWVNDGHYTNPNGVARRFVPGTWQGDRFIYNPQAKGGMMLNQKWVEGAHYMESSQRIIEQMIPKMLPQAFSEYLQKSMEGRRS